MGVDIKWYRKKRVTVSSKLREEILQVLPDLDAATADKILHCIFDTITAELHRERPVTIEGLGRFWIYKTLGARHNVGGKKWRPARIKTFPPKKVVKFRGSVSLRKSLWDEEEDAQS